MQERLDLMDYKKRYIVFFAVDSVIVLTAIYISYWLLHPTFHMYANEVLFISAITLLVSHHATASLFQLYNRVWAVASVHELVIVGYAVTISVVMAMLIQKGINGNIYFRVMVITWLLHIVMIGGSRFLLRMLSDRQRLKYEGEKKRVLIVGAGKAGAMLARNISRNPLNEYTIVGYVDDDMNKVSLKLMEYRVLGTTEEIPTIVKNKGVQKIIIAIPSLKQGQIKELYDHCTVTKAKVKVMPKIEDVMTGKVSVSDMQEIDIEHLLGREEVKLDMVAIAEKLTGKTVLVTGAGGSIGSEICRQVMTFNPAKLVLLGHGENSIYMISMELQKNFTGETAIIPVIADIQDRKRIFEVIEEYQPDVIYHAAAHKHVPLMEYNPREAVKNNIFGTKNVAEAAHTYNVGNFVMISTDKAVNPPNVMGATKRIAEMIVQNLAKESKTKFAAVRFGNVLGSRGSVIPLFTQQIAAGGPLTVTHPDMTRYFMTIPEAAKLVLQAGTLGGNGEIFVLDMGEPVKIVDLARNLIKLSGFTEDEIKVEFTGLRPGEKMYEELLNKEEIQEDQVFPGIYVGRAMPLNKNKLDEIIISLAKMDNSSMKELLINETSKQCMTKEILNSKESDEIEFLNKENQKI